MEKIFVVIPNWNGADLIADCLKSLEKQTLKPKIVVVDNGSVDESVAIISKQFPNLHLIKLSHNTGFAGGVNSGIEYALGQGADAIALFNNDAIATPSWLQGLVTAMHLDDKTGIVTGKLMRDDRTHIDSTGDFYTSRGMPFPRGRNQKDTGQFDVAEPVFGASGGASLYRSRLLREIGFFDEDFFAYYEDVDISFRAQLAGWHIWYTPAAVAYHHVSSTSSKLGNFSRFHSIKNFIYLYNKNMPTLLYWKYLPLYLLQLARMFVGSLRDMIPHVFIKAVLVATLKTPGTLSKRLRIQKQRQVSPALIDSQLIKSRPPKIPVL